jgi:hypothetical protein
MAGSAVYFLAGLIAGAAIAWYFTRQHFETIRTAGNKPEERSACADEHTCNAKSESDEGDENNKA